MIKFLHSIKTSYRYFPLIFVLLCILWFASCQSVISFTVAMTPEQVLEKGYPPLPENWSAGVYNHGSYYRWFSIDDQPILFLLSLFFVLSPFLFVMFVEWLEARE